MSIYSLYEAMHVIDGKMADYGSVWMGVIEAYDNGLVSKSELMKYFIYEKAPYKDCPESSTCDETLLKHKDTILRICDRLRLHKTQRYLARDYLPSEDTLMTGFFEAIEYNQKGTKSQWLSKDYYYIAYNGRLAKIRRGQTLNKLLKNGTIVGHKATCEINGCGAQFVKHRRIIEHIGKMWSDAVKEKLGEMMDGGKDCQMVIDRNFGIAYEPDYPNYNHVFAGDLCCGGSCMSGRSDEAEDFYGKIHGCYIARFYEREDDCDHQVGRCLLYEHDGHRHFIRIYGKREYFYYMLNKIQNQLKDGDLFGRDEALPNFTLETDWDGDETAMYLDGNHYGVSAKDNRFVVETDADKTFKEVTHATIDEMFGNSITCERCGETISEDDALCIDGNWYCCDECAREDGYAQCDRCLDWHWAEDMIYIEEDGNYYCDSDCAERDGYRRCEYCGEWRDGDSMLEIEGDYFCDEDCANNDGWNFCEGYQEWTTDSVYYCQDDSADYCRDYVEENKPDYELVNCEWVKKQNKLKDETND